VADRTGDPDVESKLDRRVQELIELIFDQKMMKRQMIQIGYDAEKLPLGALTKRHVQDAYEILKEIAQVMNRTATGSLATLSNDFYTRIPHDVGMKRLPPINNRDILQQKIDLVEALGQIQIAQELLRSGTSGGLHPIDQNYETLRCALEPCEKSSATFKMVNQYVQRTHAKTHNAYTYQVMEVFDMDRHGENDRYNANLRKNPVHGQEKMLLWHGSRLTNFVGIISQGLRIAPPEAPVTGYMFGKGVYFADMCSKSANYCFASSQNPTGLMLLCEVALGKKYPLKQADYYAEGNKERWLPQYVRNRCNGPRSIHSFQGRARCIDSKR